MTSLVVFHTMWMMQVSGSGSSHATMNLRLHRSGVCFFAPSEDMHGMPLAAFFGNASGTAVMPPEVAQRHYEYHTGMVVDSSVDYPLRLISWDVDRATCEGATAVSRPRHSATTLRTPSSSCSANLSSLGSSLDTYCASGCEAPAPTRRLCAPSNLWSSSTSPQ